MYAGPLTIITTVLRSRSVEYMPLPLTLGTILCSSSWLGYGLVVEDVAIIVPNAGGTVLGIMQIALYMCYVNTEESKVRAGGRAGGLY
jgi:solute carrier family 50 (sugar transporter)